MATPIRNIAFASVCSLASLQAETYNQTTYNPGTTLWNAASIWGGNEVTAGNDYQSAPDPVRVANDTAISPSFIVDVGGVQKQWRAYGQIQDTSTGSGGQPAPQSTTFAGDHLIFTSGTRLTSKGTTTTTTANFVLQDNSHLLLAPDINGGITTFAGTISVSGVTAIGVRTFNATTLNVTAPISGTGTLQLVTTGGAVAALNLNGDISGFTGTLLLSNSTTKTLNAGTFSIANSATFATLQLNWESPFFRYDLATNDVTFGSLILGADTALGNGVYDAAYLNSLTGNADLFTGIGTITVVPEPSTTALGALAAIVVTAGCRRYMRA